MLQRFKDFSIVLLPLILSLNLLACSGAEPETPSWLLGRWQVAFNPGQDDNDVLWFQQGGKVRIDTEDGRSLQGLYQIKQDELIMLIQIAPRKVESIIKISPNKDKLFFSNGAYYMKQESGR